MNIDSGWYTTKLKDVCREITVGYVGPMVNEYVEDGIPFLRSQNVEPFHISTEAIKFISAEFHAKLKKTTLKPGDVVVVRTGYPGTAAVVPKNILVSNCADLVILRPGEHLDSWFLCSLFNSTWGRGTVAGNLVGVAQQHFNVGAAKEMIVALPPLPTQRKIAAILSAYDDLIENNTRRIQILENMARNLYREWFVHFRFPGHENTPLVESALGPIPEGWKCKVIAELGEVVTGKTPSKACDEYFGDWMPFIKTPDFRGNAFCVETNEKLSEQGSHSQKNKTIPPDTLCVTCIGTAGLVTISAFKSQTNQQINSVS